MEPKKIKADQIPIDAYRLYLKLYCERKGEKNKKTIEEAKRSWLCLSVSQKTLFYKTAKKGKMLKYAHSLAKAETFLKSKCSRKENKINRPNSTEDYDEKLDPLTILTPDKENNLIFNELVENELVINNEEGTNTGENILSETENDQITQVSAEISKENDAESCLGEPSPLNNETRLDDPPETEDINSNQESSVTHLEEPAPPTVNIGKDLYEMINGASEKNWKELTKKEKNQYNSAVRAVKREYIKSYTKYLESLPQQQLFDHYMKTLH